MDWMWIAGGLVALTLGAESLIRGATALAKRFGVSDLLIGLTLVGFGTSTPELVASVEAALMEAPGVAVGNVVGSNIVNILFILGLSALIAPFPVDRRSFARDGVVVLIATAAAIGASLTGAFSRAAGLVFLAAIVLYILIAYLTERRVPDPPHAVEIAAPTRPALFDLLFALVGLGLLIIGARFLVTGAINVAASMGVSETIIGLTVVAVGTSLPELVTSIVAATRGKSALALGNVVGSNIYNLFGTLGVTAAIHPIPAPVEIVAFDNWVMLAATVVMVAFATTKNRMSRIEGALLVACYFAYVSFLVAAA